MCGTLKSLPVGGLILAFAIATPNLFAQETTPVPPTPEREYLLTPTEQLDSSFEFHGFLSQGYAQSTNNNFLPNSTQGTTKFTEAGFNINKQFTNDLRAGFQLFTRDYGQSSGIYRASFDWFLVDYHWHDFLGIRVGRIKLPFGFFNDTSDIDSARDPVLLPQSIYPMQNRDYLLAQTGVELYGLIEMGPSAGSLQYELYRGTIQIDNTAASPAATTQITNLAVPYVYGGRLIWETPVPGLRAAVSAQKVMLDVDLYSTTAAKAFSVDLPVSMLVGSAEYTYKSLQLVAEYSKWWVQSDSTNTTIFPDSGSTSEKYYAMGVYKIRHWLRPGIYYSASFPNEDKRTAAKDVWNDYAAFVRFDLYSNWLLKLEAHYMDGTAGLSSSINGGTSIADMPRDWALFMAKTTVTF